MYHFESNIAPAISEKLFEKDPVLQSSEKNMNPMPNGDISENSIAISTDIPVSSFDTLNTNGIGAYQSLLVNGPIPHFSLPIVQLEEENSTSSKDCRIGTLTNATLNGFSMGQAPTVSENSNTRNGNFQSNEPSQEFISYEVEMIFKRKYIHAKFYSFHDLPRTLSHGQLLQIPHFFLNPETFPPKSQTLEKLREPNQDGSQKSSSDLIILKRLDEGQPVCELDLVCSDRDLLKTIIFQTIDKILEEQITTLFRWSDSTKSHVIVEMNNVLFWNNREEQFTTEELQSILNHVVKEGPLCVEDSNSKPAVGFPQFREIMTTETWTSQGPTYYHYVVFSDPTDIENALEYFGKFVVVSREDGTEGMRRVKLSFIFKVAANKHDAKMASNRQHNNADFSSSYNKNISQPTSQSIQIETESIAEGQSENKTPVEMLAVYPGTSISNLQTSGVMTGNMPLFLPPYHSQMALTHTVAGPSIIMQGQPNSYQLNNQSGSLLTGLHTAPFFNTIIAPQGQPFSPWPSASLGYANYSPHGFLYSDFYSGLPMTTLFRPQGVNNSSMTSSVVPNPNQGGPPLHLNSHGVSPGVQQGNSNSLRMNSPNVNSVTSGHQSHSFSPIQPSSQPGYTISQSNLFSHSGSSQSGQSPIIFPSSSLSQSHLSDQSPHAVQNEVAVSEISNPIHLSGPTQRGLHMHPPSNVHRGYQGNHPRPSRGNRSINPRYHYYNNSVHAHRYSQNIGSNRKFNADSSSSISTIDKKVLDMSRQPEVVDYDLSTNVVSTPHTTTVSFPSSSHGAETPLSTLASVVTASAPFSQNRGHVSYNSRAGTYQRGNFYNNQRGQMRFQHHSVQFNTRGRGVFRAGRSVGSSRRRFDAHDGTSKNAYPSGRGIISKDVKAFELDDSAFPALITNSTVSATTTSVSSGPASQVETVLTVSAPVVSSEEVPGSVRNLGMGSVADVVRRRQDPTYALSELSLDNSWIPVKFDVGAPPEVNFKSPEWKCENILTDKKGTYDESMQSSFTNTFHPSSYTLNSVQSAPELQLKPRTYASALRSGGGGKNLSETTNDNCLSTTSTTEVSPPTKTGTDGTTVQHGGGTVPVRKVLSASKTPPVSTTFSVASQKVVSQ